MDSALITGCSPGGLGSGIALAFLAHNIHVFATARKMESLQHVKDLPNVTCLELDVTDKESIKRAVESVRKSGKGGGKLRYLVNNAGRGVVGPILDGDEVIERGVWEVNYWGTLNMIKAFAPLVIETKGVVVNIGSSAGVINVPWNGIYASSKAAVNMLSETLRLELEPLNVRVVTAVVGIAKSEFFTNLNSNQTEFSLPQSSYYKSLEKRIAVSARGGDLPENVMSAEQCGRDLVEDVLGGRGGNVYNGTGGFALKWVMPLVPAVVVDWYCRKRTHLGEFREVKVE